MNLLVCPLNSFLYAGSTWFIQVYFQLIKLSVFCKLSSREQSEENVLDNSLFINIDYIKNLQEDFINQFKDIINLEIPKWIICLFDVEVESANLDTFL